MNAEEYQFDRDQTEEIKAGIEAGLDVSCYVKKEFMAIQMRQIRFGLEHGIDVGAYADAEYDWFQMEEIRLGLEAGVDIKCYADKSLSYDKMRQIRKGLAEGIDLSKFSQLDAMLLRELRKAFSSDIDMMKYIKQGYEPEQLKQIRHALEKKLPIEPYLKKEFRGPSIREIAIGLENGVDVSYYAKAEYAWRQMRELRLGLEHRIDISIYINPFFNWKQMYEIRLGLEDGLDVSDYRSFMYTYSDMRRMRLKRLENRRGGKVREYRHIDDSVFSLTVSDDEMYAWLEIDEAQTEEFSPKEIVQFLQKEGIVWGVNDREICSVLEHKKYGKRVLIAEGKEPKQGKDGWYEFFFRTNPDRKPKVLEDGSVDYQNIDWFEMVNKGQKIAYYHPAENGENGCTVTGKICTARRGKEQSLLFGSGFEILEDNRTYVSSLSGKIELSGNTLEIEPILVVNDVTMVTGNIEFDGSVYVKGNVAANTRIYALEDVVIDGMTEGASIWAGGNIVLKKGINGFKSGNIEAKKNVIGGFFESVKVTAGEQIQANYCLNCELHADADILISGNKGTLIGGSAYAATGIAAREIGNRAGIVTRLATGVNEAVLEERKRIEKEKEENNKETQILKNAYADMEKKYSPEKRNSMEIYLKIEKAIYTKEKQMEELELQEKTVDAKIWNMGKAAVTVKGNIYDGTEVKIEYLRWRAAQDVKNVTIRKTNDRIAVFAN